MTCHVTCDVFAAYSDSVWSVAWTRNETLNQELILSGSVYNTARVWAWLVNYDITMMSCVAIYRDDNNSLLEPKWTFDGHQLGVVSVATNATGTGRYDVICSCQMRSQKSHTM